MKRLKKKDKLIIADTQCTNDTPTEHLEALSHFIWKNKPKHIIHLGDHWDFPSLSSYNSELESEGLRLYDDLEGGFAAFRKIMAVTDQENKKRKYKYKPIKDFLMGNHENRLKRFIDKNPALEGCFDLAKFVKDQGWYVHDFLQPLWIDDIMFIHYLTNPMSGRAVGGSIENKLNKTPHSFVHGHQQQVQYGSRQNKRGEQHFGICAGAFYLHDEDYRGYDNTEKRACVYLKAYENRYGNVDHDIEIISVERMLAEYS